jgi:3'-phosphoadenosine 5'-phosphosulfate sulfotransferase (PAPS reductase)/FAD synthetase
MENKYNNNPSKSVYHDKCLAFLNISEKIRYVGIINRFGRTLSGKLRKNVKPLLSPEQARDEHFIEAMRQQLRNSFESSIGKTIFSITKNELVTLALVPSKTSDDVLYYVTIDKDVPLDEVNNIINKVVETEE